MAANQGRTPNGRADGHPLEPKDRLVRTSFARLSSGFRVTDPSDDRAVMELSDALQARLQTRLRSGDTRHANANPPAMTSVLARMRTIARGVEGGAPLATANAELSELVAQLRAGLEAAENADERSRDRSSGDVGPNRRTSAALTIMQRLMGAIARARAIEGNVAGAESDAEVVSRAEESLVLDRAQALLEEGVARFTRAPSRPKARQLLN